MKYAELFENHGNHYFKVKKPVKVWTKTGTEPSNEWYGASQIHRATWDSLNLEKGDEIHYLHGGTFVVQNAGTVHEVKLSNPPRKGAFEKNYGVYHDPNATKINDFLEDNTIERISHDDAKQNVKYRPKT